MLAPDGVCVTIGVSGGPEARIAVSPFYMTGGASIYGLALFHEIARRERASIGLARLLSLLTQKKLQVHVAVERSWDDVAEVARDLVFDRPCSTQAESAGSFIAKRSLIGPSA